MKGIGACVFFLFCGLTLFGNPADTTVTSFEIYLYRKSSDNPIGFNTCSIDRSHIYNLVMEKISGKVDTKNFLSVHKPLVLMKFHDVIGKERHSKNQIANDVMQSMKGHQYKYFIKIYGNLDIDTPLNQFQKATFTLKVYVFDSAGNLVAKSKSRSREKNLASIHNTKANVEENYPVSEQEFFELVTDAANTIEISI
jgi:hypothetical protein